jgi:hypothetical protein
MISFLKGAVGGVALVFLAIVVQIVTWVRFVRSQFPDASVSFSPALFLQPRMLGLGCILFAGGFAITWIFVRR